MDNNRKTTPVGAEVIENETTDIIPRGKQIVKTDEEIDAFIETRKSFITKVSAICVEGKDYHVIQGKKSLAKGGAEKIASIFKWTAKFDKDTEALEMLGDMKGLVAFKCTLMNGQFVGEGRGSALLSKNGSDPNKTLKMAQKSAFIDAVLRASGLSDFFTQDLEDMPHEQISQAPQTNYPTAKTSSYPPSEKQHELIQNLMDQKRVEEAWVFDQGFDLKNLTGGREGTASELITFLKIYVPERSVTIDHDQRTSDSYMMIAKLEQAKDSADLLDIKNQLSKMRTEQRFTKEDLEALTKAYEKVNAELNHYVTGVNIAY